MAATPRKPRTPARVLTARFCDSVKPGPTEAEYPDLTERGLRLRVLPSGVKSWTLRYRYHGRLKRVGFGPYPDTTLDAARKRAHDAKTTIQADADPGAERQAERAAYAHTVTALYDTYARTVGPRTKRKSLAKRSWPAEARILKRDVVKPLGRRLVADLTRTDVLELVYAKAERAPIAANRLATHLSRLLDHAVALGWTDRNVAARLEKPADERQRDRVLTPAELRTLWPALHASAADIAAEAAAVPRDATGKPTREVVPLIERRALLVQLLTAQRLGEVARMTRAAISADHWWTIPASDAKNKHEHTVWLSEPVRAVLDDVKGDAPGVYVFSRRKGKQPIYWRLKRAAHHLSAALGFAFTSHDLRRTAATIMQEAGVSLETLAHVLNHRTLTRATVTAIYARHDFGPQKRAALDTLAAALDKIVTASGGGAVVQFARR